MMTITATMLSPTISKSNDEPFYEQHQDIAHGMASDVEVGVVIYEEYLAIVADIDNMTKMMTDDGRRKVWN